MRGNKILIIHGPNLNLLKFREGIYGNIDNQEFEEILLNYEKNIEFYQSNHEGDIIDKIQSLLSNDKYYGLIINPGGYTHYSISILDALKMINIPKVEVHLTKIENRENYRNVSITKDGCDYYISGEGINGYKKAIDIIKEKNG